MPSSVHVAPKAAHVWASEHPFVRRQALFALPPDVTDENRQACFTLLLNCCQRACFSSHSALNRIPRSDGFSALLANRPRCRTRRLQCFSNASSIHEHAPGQPDTSESPLAAPRVLRLGILVPKRWARRAVDRHCLKRIVRDAFVRSGLSEGLQGDLLVRLTVPVHAIGPGDRHAWQEELQQLFSMLRARS